MPEFFSKFFNRNKTDKRKFPFYLTGDTDSAFVTVRAAHQADIVAIAVAKGEASVLVTEEFRRTDEFKEISRRLAGAGWNLTTETNTGSVIRSHYGKVVVARQGETEAFEERSTDEALFDQLVKKAIENRASNLRLHYRVEICGITHEIDNVVHKHESIPGPAALRIASSCYTNWADPKSREKGKGSFDITQDQSCKINRIYNGKEYELRYQHVPEGDEGCDVTLRILAQGELGQVPTLEERGFTPSAVAILKKSMARPKGMVLITGPQGSGKTTTLYSMLHTKQGERPNYVLTLEDPIEYKQYGVTRIALPQLGDAENANKVVLRTGAHRALIGEIRNYAMASVAKAWQQVGIKVASTLHVNGANEIIDRLTGDELRLPRQTVCTIDMIALQFYVRLVGKLHTCAKPATPELIGPRLMAQMERLNIPISNMKVRNHEGCPGCRKGVLGRVPLCEAIVPTKHYMRLMREGRDEDAKDYWLDSCTTAVTEEDITGKPIIANALYRAFIGDIDLEAVESIDDIETFEPRFVVAKPTELKVA